MKKKKTKNKFDDINATNTTSSVKLKTFLIVIILFFLALIIRLIFLQFVDGSELQSAARSRQTLTETISAKRGTIFDINGKTLAKRFEKSNYQANEIAKIEREVINTHGELIFSSAIVLCEGITEEQALPIYFKEFFGVEPVFLGINIIGIGGQNYQTYLKFIKEFELKWYIFSDGEKAAKKSVNKAVKVLTNVSYENLPNVVVIENGYDYEKMLIKNGNSDEIIAAINEINENENYYTSYIEKLNGEVKTKRRKTDKPPCALCGQDIYEDYVEELLRNAEDTEYSDMKVTIYEQNENIIRTAVSIGTDSIIIESSKNNTQNILKVQHELLNNEKEVSQQVSISKSTTDSNEEYIFNIEVVNGEEKYSVDATVDSDYKNINLDLDFYKDIVNINVKAKNSITDTLSQKVELGTSNNIVVNDLNSDLLKVVVDKMKSAYTDTLVKRYNILVRKLKSEDLMKALKSILSEGNFDEEEQPKQSDTSIEEQMTKEEINRFNAKFEFYSGTEISGENVKVLLDVVKDNLESVDITPVNTTESTSDNKTKENIKLNIKKDNENVDLANAVIDKIDSEKKYDITINYNKDTGMTESIIIVLSK